MLVPRNLDDDPPPLTMLLEFDSSFFVFIFFVLFSILEMESERKHVVASGDGREGQWWWISEFQDPISPVIISEGRRP